MRRITTLFFIALLLSGCASVDDSKRTITLDKATRIYDNAIRWGDHDVANSLRKQPAAGPVPALLRQIKVTSLEPVNVSVSEDQLRVQRVVEIRYYNENSMKIVTLMDHQTWEYDAAAKSWFLLTPPPAFR